MPISLNPQQEAAANHKDGPCLVVAVPGSGKTRLLVERAAKLLDSGVSPANLLCITFTNKAADEMKDRLAARLKSSRPKMFVGTFHALCALLLRKFGERLGYETFTICDSDEQVDIIKQLARRRGMTIVKKDAYAIAQAINNYRENDVPSDYLDNCMDGNYEYIALAKDYLTHIKRIKIIDFSGLLAETITLLREHDDIRDIIQEKFKYIQVDEVQDTNYAQFLLLNLFSEKYNNIMMVGDISQSVYRFRGARYQNIHDFIDKHEDCKQFTLPLNYRSTPEIVATADKLIRKNSSHMSESFVTENPSGNKVHCFQFETNETEAEFVAATVRRLMEDGGWDAGDCAVLYRMNAMSECLERAFTNAGMKCKVIGGRSFYARKEVKDCIAMLRLRLNPYDALAFHRVATIIPGMGDTTVARIEERSENEGITLLESAASLNPKGSKVLAACKQLVSSFDFDPSSAAESLATIADRLEQKKYLKKQYKDDDGEERCNNVDQVIDSAANFAHKQSDTSIEKYLEMVALVSANDTKGDSHATSLMTLHAAKGLEFPIVFMVGVEQGILPHFMSISEDRNDGTDDGEQEERRLCYVGLTRAEKQLYTSYCKQRIVFVKNEFTGKRERKAKYCKPSQFLYEANLLQRKAARV